jgi:hypothetical protein
VEYGEHDIALFWYERKLVVEIDLRDAPPAELIGRPGFEPGRDGNRLLYAEFRPPTSA